MANEYKIEVPVEFKTKGGGTEPAGGGGISSIGGMGKIGGALAGILVAIESLSFIIKPFFSMFKVITTLLFLPLIPLLKPVLMLLGEMAKTMAPIMMDIAKAVDDAFKSGGFAGALGVFFEEMIALIVEFMPVVLNAFLGLIDILVESLPVIIPALVGGFVALINGLVEYLPEFIDAFSQVILALLPLVPLLVDSFIQVIMGIIQYLPIITEALTAAFVYVIEAMIPMIPQLIDSFILFIEALIPHIPTIIASLVKVFNEIGKSILRSIWDSRSKNLGGNGRGNLEPDKIVTDAIIRPSGQIIRTNPLDTLIAMKDPSGLGRGGGGNITIQINSPQFQSESDMRKLTEIISRRLQMQARRSI